MAWVVGGMDCGLWVWKTRLCFDCQAPFFPFSLYHATLFVITFPSNWGCMFGFGFRVALLSAWLSFILLVYLFWRN